MKSPPLLTYCSHSAMLTHCHAFNTAYTVYTSMLDEYTASYLSMIRFSQYKQILWTLSAASCADAIANHLGLLSMAKQQPVLHWRQRILQQCYTSTGITADQHQPAEQVNNFTCTAARQLLQASGIQLVQTQQTTWPEQQALLQRSLSALPVDQNREGV